MATTTPEPEPVLVQGRHVVAMDLLSFAYRPLDVIQHMEQMVTAQLETKIRREGYTVVKEQGFDDKIRITWHVVAEVLCLPAPAVKP